MSALLIATFARVRLVAFARFVGVTVLTAIAIPAPTTLFGSGTATPSKSIEHFHFWGFWRSFLGWRISRLNRINGRIVLLSCRVSISRNFRRHISSFSSLIRFCLCGCSLLYLNTLTFVGFISKTGHQISELLKGHARYGQHIRRRLKATTGVLIAQHIGQTLKHIDADRALTRRAVARH